MFNTQFSVSDIVHFARCYTNLAAEGMGVAIGAGNASVDVSGRLGLNRSTGFGLERLPKHSNVPDDETTSWLGEGGVWGGVLSGVEKRIKGGFIRGILFDMYSFYVYISKLDVILK